MSECIHCHFSANLAYISAVCNLDTLRYRDHYGRLVSCQLFNVCNKPVDIEYSLRQINRITSLAVVTLRQRCRCSQPACVTSHDLHDTYGRLLRTEGLVVTNDLLHGSCDILRSGTVTRAVIRYRQIVINGLRNAHEPLRLIVCCRIVGQHLNGIHGIITSGIEQTLDVMLLHDLEYLLIYILMSFDLRHFKTAGTEECRRSSL